MRHYVYQTTNNINRKIYVGVSSNENPKIHTDYLGSGVGISRAIRKYGRDAFSKIILGEFPTRAEADLEEARIVTEEFVTRKDTYNFRTGGSSFWKHSQESNKKNSLSKMGKSNGPHSIETRSNISKGNKGKKMSIESRQRMSETRIRKLKSGEIKHNMVDWIATPEQKLRMSEALKNSVKLKEASARRRGTKMSPEACQKMSETRKAKIASGEIDMSASRSAPRKKGGKRSEETRRKMSETRKRKIASGEIILPQCRPKKQAIIQ